MWKMQFTLQHGFSSQLKARHCSVVMDCAPTESTLPAELLWAPFSQGTDRHTALKTAAKAFSFAVKHQLFIKHLSELQTAGAL